MTLFLRGQHLRDQDILLLQEGELSEQQATEFAKHLYSCRICQAKHAALKAASEHLDELKVVPADAAEDALRNHLQSRLAEAAAVRGEVSWLHTLRQPKMLARLASVAALLAVSIAWQQAYRPLQDRMGPYEETGPKPVRALTPGAVRPVALSELCSLPDNDLDPKVPVEKQRAVFRAYGMDDRAARGYQVDYLINPQLGGDDDVENLWPEPYHSTVWNATAKDALETKLHSMVCGGQLDLTAAQHELATDWVAAYKKYFHADRPVSTVAAADGLPVLER
ncbi:hypothetical protein [Terriglobus roseus]|uniref:Zinc-finger n=1 Tax=Terriglobus roseus TaxID=392734 RepID=A0A1H4M6Z9_9BACT|nr:hypothetical protein [Terriglobus roseus]SEB78587.1 hypothetical protein SAMN05443244_1835 [Terriglobus roseus]